MKLNKTGSPLTRIERNNLNDNWDIIENSYNNVVEEVSNTAFDKVIDGSRIDWSQMVDTVAGLPADAEEGEARGVKADNKIYRYNGTAWIPIAEINLNPIAEVDSRLGNKIDGVDDRLGGKIDDNHTSVATQLAQTGVYVGNYGAVGDGIADDYNAITLAVSVAIEKNKPLILGGKHYVSQTLDFSGLTKVIGTGCSDSILFDSRVYQGQMVGRGWFLDNKPSYEFFKEGIIGDCILSDVARPIVLVKTGRTSFEGVGVYGWLDNKTQVGIADEVASPTAYAGTIKDLKNVKVKYCGSHGVYLRRGIEYGDWADNQLRDNGGHGLFIERTLRDSPCEYTNFFNCRFDNNFLEGVNIIGFKKNIVFDTCFMGRNGQYFFESSIGFDRSYPSEFKDVKAGLLVSTYGNVPGSSLKLINCYGEDAQIMLKLANTSTSGVLNNITIESTSQQPMQYTEPQSSWKKAMLVTHGYYIQNIKMLNNSGTNGVVGIVDLGTSLLDRVRIEGSLRSTEGIDISKLTVQERAISVNENLTVETTGKFDNKSSLLFKSVGGNSLAWVDTFDFSKFFASAGGNTRGVYPMVVLLNSNWQANNNNRHGSYLLVVQKSLDGNYRLNTLAFGSVLGITVPPTIDAVTGIMTLSLDAFYAYTLTRLDMQSVISLN